jgi:DNA-binding NtrC family response regulator
MTGSEKFCILVVDDEVPVCTSIRQALVRETYEIDVAFSGEEALRLADKKNHQVIIIDLMMPGIGGLDLLKSIKAKNPSAKVIMVTGYPTMKNTLQAMQLGAFDFLPKPFLPAELRSLVARALASEDKAPSASGASG